eukprot:scaffold34159_cov58-Phaeocystis_antarctica.AAC.4
MTLTRLRKWTWQRTERCECVAPSPEPSSSSVSESASAAASSPGVATQRSCRLKASPSAPDGRRARRWRMTTRVESGSIGLGGHLTTRRTVRVSPSVSLPSHEPACSCVYPRRVQKRTPKREASVSIESNCCCNASSGIETTVLSTSSHSPTAAPKSEPAPTSSAVSPYASGEARGGDRAGRSGLGCALPLPHSPDQCAPPLGVGARRPSEALRPPAAAGLVLLRCVAAGAPPPQQQAPPCDAALRCVAPAPAPAPAAAAAAAAGAPVNAPAERGAGREAAGRGAAVACTRSQRAERRVAALAGVGQLGARRRGGGIVVAVAAHLRPGRAQRELKIARAVAQPVQGKAHTCEQQTCLGPCPLAWGLC